MLMVCLAKKLRGCKEQIIFLPLIPSNKENAPVSYTLIVKQRTHYKHRFPRPSFFTYNNAINSLSFTGIPHNKAVNNTDWKV